MKAKFIFTALIAILITNFYSCTKAGTGGNATVVCRVYNTDNGGAAVNGATVYVKYGQSTPPSGNNTGYDDHKTCDASSNSVSFTGLKEGTYYFYAEGNVPTGTGTSTAPVSGGNPFSLTHANRNGSSNATISVTY